MSPPQRSVSSGWWHPNRRNGRLRAGVGGGLGRQTERLRPSRRTPPRPASISFLADRGSHRPCPPGGGCRWLWSRCRAGAVRSQRPISRLNRSIGSDENGPGQKCRYSGHTDRVAAARSSSDRETSVLISLGFAGGGKSIQSKSTSKPGNGSSARVQHPRPSHEHLRRHIGRGRGASRRRGLVLEAAVHEIFLGRNRSPLKAHLNRYNQPGFSSGYGIADGDTSTLPRGAAGSRGPRSLAMG